ncbi:MAG: hypothetical protein WCO69_01220 [Candidatus Omnitrophota bacterium]
MTVKSIEKTIMNLKPLDQMRIVENVLAKLLGRNPDKVKAISFKDTKRRP